MLRQGTMPGQYVLEYYVDRTAKKLKGSIDLDQCEQVRTEDRSHHTEPSTVNLFLPQVDSGLTFECGKIRFQFMFDIKTPRRVYYLAAEGEEDMNTWVDLVCRVCGLHNFTCEKGEGQGGVPGGGEEEGSVVTQQPAISGPYMHLSECFTGAQPAQVRTRARLDSSSSSSQTVTRLTQASTTTVTTLCDDSVLCGDDSVFLPNSPATKLSQLSLSPGRPPKPSNLRNLSFSQHSSSSASENYENQPEVGKLETNNNCDNSESPTFLPPCIDRTLKPERMPGPAGPPVERNRKPRQVAGLSLPGEEEEDSDQEQIYFYMPSLNTCSTPGFNTKWDPILIPAKELTDNAVQYLDLDLAPADTSFSDCPGTER